MISGFNHLNIGSVTIDESGDGVIDSKYAKILDKLAENKKPIILECTLNIRSSVINSVAVATYLNRSFNVFNGEIVFEIRKYENVWTIHVFV